MRRKNRARGSEEEQGWYFVLVGDSNVYKPGVESKVGAEGKALRCVGI